MSNKKKQRSKNARTAHGQDGAVTSVGVSKRYTRCFHSHCRCVRQRAGVIALAAAVHVQVGVRVVQNGAVLCHESRWLCRSQQRALYAHIAAFSMLN